MTTTVKTASPKIREICVYLQQKPDTGLSLKALAKRFDLSPHYLQRKFKAEVGVSPKQYVDGLRVQSLKLHLKQSTDVTEALYGAGYSSSSRVYERSNATLGMTPAQYQKGGKGLHINFALSASPLGHLLLAATRRGICFIQFDSNKNRLKQCLVDEFPQAAIAPMDESRRDLFDQWMACLNDFLKGACCNLDLPVDVQGTAFQIKVWAYLQQIPYGELRTYADVAEGIGKPKAIRAVGTACGANKIALAIPCHRVIRGDGSLGGYRWGLERKQRLLDLESSLNT